MKNPKQRTFEGLRAPKDVFGGSLLTSNPKVRRPLDSKLPTHVVLRATKSTMRKPQNFLKVNQAINNACRKHGVRLYEYANVGNHLHLLIKLRSRASWAGFIREITGRIAQLTETKWLHRPFTRIVRGCKSAYKVVKSYIELNEFEAKHCLSLSQLKLLRELRRSFG